MYRGADKSLARPGRKQARKHVRDARDFNKLETRAVIRFLFLQGKAPKEIDAILTETLACFLPGRSKDLPAPRYIYIQGDSGGICITLGNDSMSDSKQKSSYDHGSDFERLRSYGHFVIPVHALM